jgi:hypothetical protein
MRTTRSGKACPLLAAVNAKRDSNASKFAHKIRAVIGTPSSHYSA